MLENDPDFVSQYTFIVATNQPESTIIKLAQSCEKHQIPLAIVWNYGLIGYLRLQTPSYPVIESKPDHSVPDLRLYEPFHELLEYVQKYDFQTLDGAEHAHIPFPVILIKAVQNWRKVNGFFETVSPTFKNKAQILQQIALLRNSKASEGNFDEAIKFAMRTYIPYKLDEQVEAVLANPLASSLDTQSSDFWITVHALKEFRANEGKGIYLPLIGTIPDMETESSTFAEIKNIYNNKAAQDVQKVVDYVKESLNLLQKPLDSISIDFIKSVCKNSFDLRNFTFRSLNQEYSLETAHISFISDNLFNNQDSNLVWYVLLRSSQRFESKHGHYPCSVLNQDMETEIEEFNLFVIQFLHDHALGNIKIKNEYIYEFCRWGASSLHNIGAILGGVTAQEIIKVVTEQWVPLNNTWIFNGLNSSSEQFDL